MSGKSGIILVSGYVNRSSVRFDEGSTGAGGSGSFVTMTVSTVAVWATLSMRGLSSHESARRKVSHGIDSWLS